MICPDAIAERLDERFVDHALKVISGKDVLAKVRFDSAGRKMQYFGQVRCISTMRLLFVPPVSFATP